MLCVIITTHSGLALDQGEEEQIQELIYDFTEGAEALSSYWVRLESLSTRWVSQLTLLSIIV